jgi:hypothetical protein
MRNRRDNNQESIQSTPIITQVVTTVFVIITGPITTMGSMIKFPSVNAYSLINRYTFSAPIITPTIIRLVVQRME